MKKYVNLAMIYASIGLVGGVFYREFTKLNGFTDVTTLGKLHVHYLVLGMFFFLLLCLFTKEKDVNKKGVIMYQVGLNLSAIMMLVRGITQVLNMELSSGAMRAFLVLRELDMQY